MSLERCLLICLGLPLLSLMNILRCFLTISCLCSCMNDNTKETMNIIDSADNFTAKLNLATLTLISLNFAGDFF